MMVGNKLTISSKYFKQKTGIKNSHGCFRKYGGFPPNHPFKNLGFPWNKPSVLGYPYFWKHPWDEFPTPHFQGRDHEHLPWCSWWLRRFGVQSQDTKRLEKKIEEHPWKLRRKRLKDETSPDFFASFERWDEWIMSRWDWCGLSLLIYIYIIWYYIYIYKRQYSLDLVLMPFTPCLPGD